MVPVPTEDFELDPPGGSFWQSLLNLAISVLVVCAAALIGSFLSATTAHARTAAKVMDRGELQKARIVDLEGRKIVLDRDSHVRDPAMPGSFP